MSESTAAITAIPIEAILSDLRQHCFVPQAARVLEHHDNFRPLQFQCHRIDYVHDLATSPLNIPISISGLALGFSCKRARIISALTHGLESFEMRGIIRR
jgi:hypothetical protein